MNYFYGAFNGACTSVLKLQGHSLKFLLLCLTEERKLGLEQYYRMS